MTLQRLEREIVTMDPALTKESDEFRAAVLLLAGLSQPRTVRGLQRFTGYPRGFVDRVVRVARVNGIFRDDGVACEWFEKDGGTAFWLDVCCALGLMQRTR